MVFGCFCEVFEVFVFGIYEFEECGLLGNVVWGFNFLVIVYGFYGNVLFVLSVYE